MPQEKRLRDEEPSAFRSRQQWYWRTAIAVIFVGALIAAWNLGATSTGVVSTTATPQFPYYTQHPAPVDPVNLGAPFPSPPAPRTPTELRNDLPEFLQGGSTAIVGSPDGRFMYVTDSAGTFYVFDTDTRAVNSLNVGQHPPKDPRQPYGGNQTGNDLAVTPDGKQVYVTDRLRADVLIVDPSRMTIVGAVRTLPVPMAVAVSPDGTRAYVSDKQTNSITVIDTSTRAVTATWTVDGGPAEDLAVAPDGRRLVTLSHTSQSVESIDTSSGRANAWIHLPIPAAAENESFALSPDSNLAYVPYGSTVSGNRGETVEGVAILNLPMKSVTAIVRYPGTLAVAVSGDGQRMYVVSEVYGPDTCPKSQQKGAGACHDAIRNVATLETRSGYRVLGGISTTILYGVGTRTHMYLRRDEKALLFNVTTVILR